MTPRPDYYQLLHVSPDAPAPVIRASYRALMRALRRHPDVGGDHEDAVQLNEAYATLSDPERRAAYDHARKRVAERAACDSVAPAGESQASPLTWQAGTCPFCGTVLDPCRVDHPDSTCHDCGSPLFPAPRHRTDGETRRAIERLPRSLPVTFTRAASPRTTHTGTTGDLSLQGMRLVADVPMRVGDRLRVSCAFCEAVAVVRRVRAGRGHRVYGVEFETLRITRSRGGLIATIA